MFRSIKVSDSKSKVCPVRTEIRSQCLALSALLVISSNSGHVSLKSSIFCFRALYAGQSFRARGNFRHLINLGYNLRFKIFISNI